jgi:hypothetical protein
MRGPGISIPGSGTRIPGQGIAMRGAEIDKPVARFPIPQTGIALPAPEIRKRAMGIPSPAPRKWIPTSGILATLTAEQVDDGGILGDLWAERKGNWRQDGADVCAAQTLLTTSDPLWTILSAWSDTPERLSPHVQGTRSIQIRLDPAPWRRRCMRTRRFE